jgi:hypothetical protein
MQQLRLLHFLPKLPGGGAERQCVRLMGEVHRRGHRIGVCYLYDGPGKPDLMGIEEFRIEGRGNYDPRILVRLIRANRQFGPQVVQSWILQMDVLGGIAARLMDVAWILREPSCANAWQRGWKTGLRAWMGLFTPIGGTASPGSTTEIRLAS